MALRFLLPALVVAATALPDRPSEETQAKLPVEDEECDPNESSDCALKMLQLRATRKKEVKDTTSSAETARGDWAGSCASYGCHTTYHRHFACQCNAACINHGNCCGDFQQKCAGGGARQNFATPSGAADSHSPVTLSPPGVYHLNWAAKGTSFFNGWNFLTQDMNHGAAQYLGKGAALADGVAEAYGNHAILRAGKVSAQYKYKRQTAKIETQKSWKHFLAVLKYSHLPYGCGVWPAFFTLGVGKGWPAGGEVDILEYVNMDVSKSSVHLGPGCTLKPSAVSKYGYMPDRNNMNYDCHTQYPDHLGCAPNKWMKTGQAWSSNPGAVALEWTEDFIKLFSIPHWEIPSDLESDTPKPETWDKWLFSYYPLKESGCPADIMAPQKMVMQIGFCGDWASKVWDSDQQCKGKVHNCRSVDPLHEYAPGQDCCTQFISDEGDKHGTNEYLKQNAYFNVSWLKVFQTR